MVKFGWFCLIFFSILYATGYSKGPNISAFLIIVKNQQRTRGKWAQIIFEILEIKWNLRRGRKISKF